MASWPNKTHQFWCDPRVLTNKYGEKRRMYTIKDKQVPCSLNPSLDTPKVTGLFLQLHHASRNLYHLISDLVFVPQSSNLFSKLILCHRFNFVSGFLSFCF